MSKVKFIQLSADSKAQYEEKLADAKSSYPGAVIFVTYTDDTNSNKQKQEIWANGKKYEVGGGGGNVVYGTDMIDADGRTYIWQIDKQTGLPAETEDGKLIPEYTGITGSDGSIYVYTGEKTQTAYYWVSVDNSGKWVPFNVDAENVWFHEDITLAGNYTSIGNFSKTSITGTASLYDKLGLKDDTTDFSLKTLITKLLSEVVFPTPSNPSYATLTSSVTAPSITSSTSGVANNAILNIGDEITIKSVTANDSTYSGQKYTKISGLTHGYSNDGKTLTSANSYIQTGNYATPTLTSNTVYTLSYSITSGFSTLSLPTDASDAAAANCSIDAIEDIKVDKGKNTLTLTETGRGHTTTATALSSVYITSNIGTWDTSHKTNTISAKTLTSTNPSNSTSFTVYGVMPIYTNGASSSITDKGTYVYSDAIYSLANNYVYQVSNNKVITQQFKLGFAGPAAGAWILYVPTGSTFTALQYNTASGKYDLTRVFTKSAESDKSGYDKYMFTDTNAGNGTVQISLTIKN